MIEIPQHKDYFFNMERRASGTYPCVVCGKSISKPIWMVHLIWATHIGTVAEALEHDGGEMGLYPIGTDCIRNHPAVKPYIIRASQLDSEKGD